MPFNTGINRVFLLGFVGEDPNWQIIEGQRMLCFTLSTSEVIKKGDGAHEHVELHSIKISPDVIKHNIQIRKNELVYLQGKIQTRIIYENGVKLYKAEILATSLEHLKTENKMMHVL